MSILLVSFNARLIRNFRNRMKRKIYKIKVSLEQNDYMFLEYNRYFVCVDKCLSSSSPLHLLPLYVHILLIHDMEGMLMKVPFTNSEDSLLIWMKSPGWNHHLLLSNLNQRKS